VTFKDGTTTLGMRPLSNGTASLSTSTLSVGVHSITASYAGDANFKGSTSSVLLQTVLAAAAMPLTGLPGPATEPAFVQAPTQGEAMANVAVLATLSPLPSTLVNRHLLETGELYGARAAAGSEPERDFSPDRQTLDAYFAGV
jgi:hypothetical protein